MNERIRGIVAHYVKKCGTRDPFAIASFLNVEIITGNLGSRAGCYKFLKKHRCIFLNENLSYKDRQLVMAHELGHAILHRKQDCYFIRNHTLLLNSKVEREANMFAAELLIEDDFVSEYRHYTVSQMARLTGYAEELIRLRLTHTT